jgi:hypothetical protein
MVQPCRITSHPSKPSKTYRFALSCSQETLDALVKLGYLVRLRSVTYLLSTRQRMCVRCYSPPLPPFMAAADGFAVRTSRSRFSARCWATRRARRRARGFGGEFKSHPQLGFRDPCPTPTPATWPSVRRTRCSLLAPLGRHPVRRRNDYLKKIHDTTGGCPIPVVTPTPSRIQSFTQQ